MLIPVTKDDLENIRARFIKLKYYREREKGR